MTGLSCKGSTDSDISRLRDRSGGSHEALDSIPRYQTERPLGNAASKARVSLRMRDTLSSGTTKTRAKD
jgi:hypothetical protein